VKIWLKNAQPKLEKAHGAKKGRFGKTNPFWMAPKIGQSGAFSTTYNQKNKDDQTKWWLKTNPI